MATPPHDTIRKRPWLALILAWILPGAGHAYLGMTGHAVLFFVLISATFFAGLLMGGVKDVIFPPPMPDVVFSRLIGPTQLLSGFFAIAGLVPSTFVKATTTLLRAQEVAVLYTCVAALLNVLVMLNAMETACRLNAGLSPAAPGRAGKAGGPTK